MSFLKRAIKKGIQEGLENTIGKAVQETSKQVFTNMGNSAAEKLNDAAEDYQKKYEREHPNQPQYQNTQPQQAQPAEGEGDLQSALAGLGSLGGIFGELAGSAQAYATEISKTMKECPECGTMAAMDKKFCPECGAKLPEETISRSALCPNCGKQNEIGTKFCSECGTKLPSVVRAEQRAQQKDEQLLAQWPQQLPAYPVWNGGGKNFALEWANDGGYFYFEITPHSEAQKAVVGYRILLQENGFAPEGQYPSIEHLYKKENGVSYHVDTEHCFEGETPCIYFDNREPYGGYDYKKPEEKKITNLMDLFK